MQLCSCQLGISSSRLYQFSVHLKNGSFGGISRDLMVLVYLKKTQTLYFDRVYLYCSLRSLMYGMTNSSSFYKFSVDGFGFLLAFFWGLLC